MWRGCVRFCCFFEWPTSLGLPLPSQQPAFVPPAPPSFHPSIPGTVSERRLGEGAGVGRRGPGRAGAGKRGRSLPDAAGGGGALPRRPRPRRAPLNAGSRQPPSSPPPANPPLFGMKASSPHDNRSGRYGEEGPEGPGLGPASQRTKPEERGREANGGSFRGRRPPPLPPPETARKPTDPHERRLLCHSGDGPGVRMHGKGPRQTARGGGPSHGARRSACSLPIARPAGCGPNTPRSPPQSTTTYLCKWFWEGRGATRKNRRGQGGEGKGGWGKRRRVAQDARESFIHTTLTPTPFFCHASASAAPLAASARATASPAPRALAASTHPATAAAAAVPSAALATPSAASPNRPSAAACEAAARRAWRGPATLPGSET